MRLWIILPTGITDDRAYLLGYLRSKFDEIETCQVSRFADRVPSPSRRPHVILNLVSARSRALLDDIDAKARKFGVPLSPPAEGSWRAEDKRTYLEDYPDESPPTRIARSLEEVVAAREEFGGDIVVKDPFGDRGVGVERVRCDADLHLVQQLFSNSVCNTGDVIVQPYLSGFSKGDKRVVLQRMPDNSFQIIAHIFRKPPEGGWKSNIRSGGRVLRTDLTDAEIDLALTIAPRAGIDNVGFDIAEHDGRLYYIEHNQGYGGIIDFDLDRGARSVSLCADFLHHIARYGRPTGDPLSGWRPAAE